MTGHARRTVPWDEINEQRRTRAAKAPGAPRDLDGCAGEHCSAKIRWAVTVDGKRMPVDFDPDPAGNLIRVMVAANDWRIRVLSAGETPGPDVLRWTSHYATCPDADRFRSQPAPAPRRLRLVDPPAELSAVDALAPLGADTITPPRERTLLAIDGNSLAHRAFHAYERAGMATPDGRPIYAVYGFLALLAGICGKVDPDALVVGFDDRSTSARRDRYPQYKAQRTEKSPDLYAQLDDIVTVLGQLGVHVIVPAGLEADDVIGSAAAAAETAGWRCVIATSDKDSFALITEATTVLRLVSGLDNAVPMTPRTLLEGYGVTPAQYPDYAALVGDTSDNLPGVTGIGPKTAVKLLTAVGSVTAALDDPAATVAAIGKAAAAKLATDDAREALERNWDLMAIRRDVPVDPEACRPATAPGTVAAVLRDRHLSSLAGKVTAALCQPTPPSSPPAARERRHPTDVADPPPPPPPPPRPMVPQEAPPFVAADPAPVCPDCGQTCAASLPLAQAAAGRDPELTGTEVLVDQEHPAGDLLAVLVGDVWAVRHVQTGEYHLPTRARRRAHHCQTYPHKCVICGAPGRLYLGGGRCDDHRPRPNPAEPHAMS